MGDHRNVEVLQAEQKLSDMWIVTGNYKKTTIRRGKDFYIHMCYWFSCSVVKLNFVYSHTLSIFLTTNDLGFCSDLVSMNAYLSWVWFTIHLQMEFLIIKEICIQKQVSLERIASLKEKLQIFYKSNLKASKHYCHRSYPVLHLSFVCYINL